MVTTCALRIFLLIVVLTWCGSIFLIIKLIIDLHYATKLHM